MNAYGVSPRINKAASRLDREQKSAGEYYYAVAE